MIKRNTSAAGKFAAVAATVGLVASGVGAHAQADTLNDHYPETPKTNASLPIVNTYHGSDHIKANILNPRPVCNSAEDFRTVVYKVTDNFSPAGTISATNGTASTIPLTQDLTKSQSISLSIKGDRTETTSVNFGGNASGDKGSISTGISYSLAKTLGFDASYSLSWNVGQKIGPYDVPAGMTGEATYGFRTITMTGTQQYCKPNGTWSTPTAWASLTPVKNQVNVKLYGSPAGAAEGAKPEGAKVEEDAQPTEGATTDAITQEAAPAEAAAAEAIAEKSETVELAEEQAAEQAATDVDADTDAPIAQEDYDLEPYFQTSGAKAKGFAGTVVLKVKNVGSKRYYQGYPLTTFRLEVKTDEGPEGVDRLITPRSFGGAHIIDEGFNPESSTRTFTVTLSNPINAGDTATVAALDFGDGNTREGRLYNYLEVSQTGRHDQDTSTGNDQNVDSREHTVTDTGRSNAGIF